MISKPQQWTSISKGSHNPWHTLPCLHRVLRPLDPAKMKSHAEAGETDRTRAARKILLRKAKVRHVAVVKSANLHVLNSQRTLKGVQLDLSIPQLDERQARPRENQSLDLCYR